MKDDLALVSHNVGDGKKKGGRDEVWWSNHLAPCREGEAGARNLVNSFPDEFCTPERIIFLIHLSRAEAPF